MKYLYIFLLAMIPISGFCQIVTGTVTDIHNQPIEAVTVTIKGTSLATATNDKGYFKINTNVNNAVLIFTATNTETLEIPLKGQNSLKVVLNPKVNSLDEVHVIAYGTNTQRTTVGSITKVSSADIEQQPVTNPLAALEGRVPGLVVTATSGMPGASFNIQVRGQNTLDAARAGSPAKDQPLFVVDGVPFAPQNTNTNQFHSVISPGNGGVYGNAYGGVSPFNSLSPADIESIEVLKDADATAIYGSRGGNGVILITTKKGKTGKTSFDLGLDNGISVIGHTMPMMNTQQYLQMRREAFTNDGLTPNNILYDPAYAPDLTVFDQSRNTDWRNYFLGNTAHHLNANAAASGGNANTQFRIASGFNRDTYIFPGNYGDNRISLSSNIHQISTDKKFVLDFTTSYSYDKNNSSASQNLLTAYSLEPNYPNPIDANGNLIWNYNGVPLDGSYASSNPYSSFKQEYTVSNTSLNSNLLLSYELISGLTLRTSLGYGTYQNKEYSSTPFSSQNPAFNPQATANFGTNEFTTWIVEPQLEYKNTFKKALYSILVGSTFQKNINNTTQIEGLGYINDDLIHSISGAPTQTASDGSFEYKYTALFARFNFRWDSKYIINFNGRRDGSSRFGPGKQFGNFGSAGAGWLFSEEGFFKQHLTTISYGKLRASYGITGSDAIGDYNFISRWAPTSYSYNNVLGYLPQNLANDQFSWATTKKLEFGLELGFLQDRILLTSAWFRNRTGNQLIQYQLPTQTGFNTVVENSPALVQNTGWEFTLQSKIIQSKSFTWNAAFNATLPKNKLLSFPGLSTSSYATTYIVGQSISVLNKFKSAGVNQQTGLFQFYDATGKITITPQLPGGGSFNDYYNIGNLDPKFYGGLQNTFAYKNFQLTVFLEFKKQLGINYLGQLNGVPGWEFNQPAALLSARWTKPGDNATFQKFTSQYNDAATAYSNFTQSDGIYSDASYLRIKTVSLSYLLPVGVLKKLSVKSIRIYANAQNLFTITNYKGNDPETQNFYGIPPLKTITGGLQFNL
jgi:TonB-linked SusC/RagA family outer membrane protein